MLFDPKAPGQYEIRAYYNYDTKGYTVTGRYAFSVNESAEYQRVQSLHKELMIREINPQNPQESAIAAGHGLIYIFRETWNTAEKIDVQVSANGKPVVTLKESAYFLLPVSEGEVSVMAKNLFNGEDWSSKPGYITVNVKAGYVYYLKAMVFPMGFSTGLIQVPHQEGAGFISNYKLNKIP